jgi:hypothetical protein
VEPARTRLAETYRALADDALSHIYPEDYARIPAEDGSGRLTSAHTVADHPEKVVRIEYLNLLHLVDYTYRNNQFEMCWRVAATLRGCVPFDATVIEPLAAFDVGIKAAIADDSVLGEIDVKLAKASYLVAVERYEEAFKILGPIGDGSFAERLDPEPHEQTRSALRLRPVRAKRKIAEAYLQMGAYAHANTPLHQALAMAHACGNRQEEDLVAHLIADAHSIPSPDGSYSDLQDGRHLNDLVHYRALLGHSEANRRRGIWSDAEEALLMAAEHSAGDARRTASIEYRLSRICVDRWRHSRPELGFVSLGAGPPAGDPDAAELNELAARAVRHATVSARLFRAMNNPIGTVRGQCLLARALLIAEHPLAAEQVLHTVRQSLRSPALQESVARPALLARFARAYGELLLYNGAIGQAWTALAHSALRYESNNDWTCHAEIWQILQAVRKSGLAGPNSEPLDREIVEDLYHAVPVPLTGSGYAGFRVPWPRSAPEANGNEPFGS